MKQGQFPAVLPLASLNGQNGFKIDGENINDWSGNSVNAVGDINGDGYDDFLIGAFGYPGWNQKGRSYVVFGGPKVSDNGILLLSSLNGTNGFKLDGENNNDRSGSSVSAAGDINGDGHADLLITAPLYPAGSYRGCSYVVFGGPQVGSTGAIALSSLNGTNGFKLDGENNNDINSFSVSGIGDINNDGHSDLLIGAIAYPSGNYTGRSYVVFGGPQVGNTGAVALLSLNGANGFKLDGENKGDQVGASVSGGDINGDGNTDLLIGAYHYLGGNSKGRSYVVFGGSGVGSGGVIALSNLNGANGFKLDGENNNDLSACSVSTLDINADGITDLLIGAPFYPSGNGIGRSYVIFGGSAVGNNGGFSLSELNGVNGFILNGEHNSDYSGYSVKAAGDVNGDGYADLLISAYGYPMNTYKGRSYVVFGGPEVGSGGVIALSGLDGVNGFKLDGENDNDVNNAAVSAAGDVNADGVADLLIGADGYPKGNNTGRTYVVFGDIPPVLVNNSLSLSVGATISLNTTFLAAYDLNHHNNTLVFIPGSVEHGQFEAVGAPGIPLSNFTQQQVINGTIQFVHDGTLVAPRYDITVRSDGIAWTGPLAAKINFVGSPISQFPAILPLASLDGIIGFKLDGEVNGDESSYPIAQAGDVNGDGYADILVGAPYHNSKTGRIYLVFGGAEIISGGILRLSDLNGTNGFKIDGETTSDYNVGYDGDFWIKGGDVNGDVYSDLLIGALGFNGGTGRSYVIFGHPQIGLGGFFSLSNLNGTNGFKIDGEGVNDYSGNSLCIAGDVNGDGYADLLIGAYRYNNYAGRSYVMFGSANGFSPTGSFLLSNLNGTNGFKLDGGSGENVGFSVNQVGDINQDGYDDLFIGAPAYYGSTVQSGAYLIWGGPFVGKNVQSNLMVLSEPDGFKCVGEVVGNNDGWSVSGGGDLNADGYPDLLIGAWGYNNQAGRTYVIFGSSFLGIEGGIFNILNLNASTGLKLDGEIPNDVSGAAVSMTGDVNGDGYGDFIIGAPWALNYIGRSYVVLGGSNGGDYNLLDLNGVNGFKIDGETSGDVSGYSVSGMGDINGDGVNDILVGARGGGSSQAGRGYVIFGDIPPVLVDNRLSLFTGAIITLNASYLGAYDRNHPNNTIVFIPSNVMHGYFQNVNQPGVELSNFTNPQLQSGTIQFVHDGTSFLPSYNMTVRSDGIAWTGPHPANITFIPATITTTIVTTSTPSPTPTPTPSLSTSTIAPMTPTPMVTSTPTPTATTRAPIVLVNNQLTLNNGSQVILSSTQLQATEAGYDNNQLVFLIGNVQNGYFTLTNKNTTRLTAFNQSQVENGEILFVSTSSNQTPSYAVMVTDGVQYTVPNYADVHLAGAPVITENTLTLQLGQTVILTSANLNVTVTDGNGSLVSQVVCEVQDLQHAIFTQLPNGAVITNFTLSDLQASAIQVTQDGSNIAPSYLLSCGGKTGVSSIPVTVVTQFSYNSVSAPQIVNDNLFITQGGTVILNFQNIYATQNGTQPLSAQAKFFVSEVMHGYFSIASLPGFITNSFTQDQLQNGSVQFTQDNSISPPNYRLAVLALGLESASLPATIFFRSVNQPPKRLHSLTDQTATVGKPFTYAIPADSFVDPEGEPLTFSISRFNSSVSLPDWLHFDDLNNRFTGTPTIIDFIPVNVTAKDPEGLAATSDFTINVSGPTTESGLSTWQKTIIGAVISGGIGIGFALVQICMKRLANKKLMQILGQGDTAYEREVVRPVMKEITERIKINRFMNATTNKELMAFKSAVRSLLSELKRRQVDLNFEEMKESQRDEIINEIGHQTYRWMKANQSGCAKCCPGMHAFFKPQMTAEKLQDGVGEIAEQIVLALQMKTRRSQISLSAGLPVSGSPIHQGNKDKERKYSIDLSEIDLPSKKGDGSERLDEAPIAELN
jgi:hypothetical protein